MQIGSDLGDISICKVVHYDQGKQSSLSVQGDVQIAVLLQILVYPGMLDILLPLRVST